MTPASPRVAPRVWLGILTFALYLIVFCTIWVINGVDYTRVGDSAETVASWYVAPLVGGAVVLIVMVTIFGWWRPALIEQKRRYPAWIWIFPGALVVLAVLALILGDSSRVTPQMWLLLVVGSLLVGFNEELLTRGQLIVALRSRFGELGVWFFSTLLFSLLHVPNMFFGTGVLGIGQLFITFFLGSALYLTRRVSGGLIVGMLVHALWDFSSFAAIGDNTTLPSLLGVGFGVAAMIVAIVLTRRENKTEHVASKATVES